LFQETLATTDPLEKVRLILAIQVQRARLRTLARWESGEID